MSISEATNSAVQTGKARQVCTDEFTTAALGLFEHYAGEQPVYHRIHRSLTEILGVDNESVVCSSIGLGSDRGRFSIGLLAPVASLPIFSVHATSPTDWVGELANQLGGRFKNRLNAYGVKLELGLPMSVEGKDIALNNAEYMQFRFITESGNFITALQAYVEPDDVWRMESALDSAQEGSVELF